MSTLTKPNKVPNDLWIARKRLGLEQKHVACLMDQQTTAQVSRYEKGAQIPGLRILIQLEIIYGTPLKFLYPEFYQQLGREIQDRLSRYPFLTEKLKELPKRLEERKRFCAYLELLEKPRLSEEEKDSLRKHILRLLRQ